MNRSLLAVVLCLGVACAPTTPADACPGGCVIDGACVPDGVRDSSGPCRACDVARAKDAWSALDAVPCDDGQFCTVADTCAAGQCAGTARDCSNGVACDGAETCDESGDRCARATPTCTAPQLCDLTTDTCVTTCTGCVIDGVCYGDGQRKSDDPCQLCAVATSRSAWSPASSGRCDDGEACTVNDTCAAGQCAGTARACDDGVACNGAETCSESAGGCVAGAATCGANQVCDVGADACVATCTGCVVAGVCYGEGQLDPSNPCRRCARATSATSFSPNDGAPCDDGLFCTAADSCSAGVCGGTARSCDDGVACNGAETCNETGGRCGAGASTCGANQLCDVTTDTCVVSCTGCVIGGVCHGEGQLDPTNPCRVCRRATSATAFSLNDGAACDDGAFCTVSDTCSAGACAGTARGCSDGVACNGAETCDETTDRCVAGSSTCTGGRLCDTGTDTCVLTCVGGSTLCATSCVDTRYDPTNCLGCGTVCAAGPNATPVCLASGCALVCAPGSLDCTTAAGCETSGLTDNANCGACGNVCPSSRLCRSGQCVSTMVRNPLSGSNSVPFARGATYNGISVDQVTGRVYWWPSYTGSVVTEYATVGDFVSGTGGRAITLASAYEGTYHAAHDGLLYYSIANTNTLISARASDGAQVSTAALAGAGFHNQSAFNWGGYSDIALYADRGGALFVVWAAAGNGNMQVSQLDPATLAVMGTPRTIPRAKTNTGFAFVALGKVYVGNTYSSPAIVGVLDFATGTYDATYTNSLTPVTGGDYLAFVAWDSRSNTLFEVSMSQVLLYPSAVP